MYTNKVCTKCGEMKSIHTDKHWCKDCKNENERERRRNLHENKKEEMRSKERERYQRNKQKTNVVVEIEDKVCTMCQEKKPVNEFYKDTKNNGRYRASCKECCSDNRKKLYTNKREYIVKQTSDYKLNKMKSNPTFKLEVRQRNRIYHALKSSNIKKSKHSMDYLGCTSDHLKKWMEYQLYNGMTMENYGTWITQNLVVSLI